MKRIFMSRAQKRKRAAEQKEKMKKFRKIISWINSSATPATSTAPPNTASPSTSNHPVPDNPDIPLPVPVAEDIPQGEIYNYITEKECTINLTDDTDPGIWNIKNTDTLDYWIRNGPTLCQNHNCDLSNSRRVYDRTGGETRYDILERVNKITKILQSKDMDILVATKLLESLKTYLQEIRDKFNEYELKARERCPNSDYSDAKNRKRKRSVRLTKYNGPEEEVLLHKSEKFKVETFLPVLDSQNTKLTKCAKAYSWIGNLFSFFSQLKTIGADDLNQKCKDLANVHHQHPDYDDLVNECTHFKHYMHLDENCKTLPALHRKIISDNLKSVFPNVQIALGVFMCMMLANCTGERSFSRLKLVKNQLRSTMGQQRLNWLSLMCMENDILKTIDFNPIINEFAAKKSRKRVC